MRRAWLLSVTLLGAGCGGSGASSGVPAEYAGLHHRESSADAYNLEIEGDGTARWQGNHCDYLDGADLRAKRDGDGVVLVAADGSATFAFSGVQVQNVHVALEAGGLRLTWSEIGGAPVIETWPEGGSCASCSGGSLVPTGPPSACAEPFIDL